jgi:hypothetical protein
MCFAVLIGYITCAGIFDVVRKGDWWYMLKTIPPIIVSGWVAIALGQLAMGSSRILQWPILTLCSMFTQRRSGLVSAEVVPEQRDCSGPTTNDNPSDEESNPATRE